MYNKSNVYYTNVLYKHFFKLNFPYLVTQVHRPTD